MLVPRNAIKSNQEETEVQSQYKCIKLISHGTKYKAQMNVSHHTRRARCCGVLQESEERP